MKKKKDFQSTYRELESKMESLAQADGDIYLPNPEPNAPVQNILICMEPSLGRWANSADEAIQKVNSGFRNFLYSVEDFILHYCVRHFLCKTNISYHITDISKGAMLVEKANSSRNERYGRWFSLLQEELNLIAKPNANVIAVGRSVSDFLSSKSFNRPFTRIIHYSGQAAAARNKGIIGHENDFDSFKESVSDDDIIITAKKVFDSNNVPSTFRESTLDRLKKRTLTLSRKKLIYNYKLSFESIRE